MRTYEPPSFPARFKEVPEEAVASPGDGAGCKYIAAHPASSLAASNMTGTVGSSGPSPGSSNLATKSARTEPQVACSAAEVLQAAGHLYSGLVVFLRLVKDWDTRGTGVILLNTQSEGHVLSRWCA